MTEETNMKLEQILNQLKTLDKYLELELEGLTPIKNSEKNEYFLDLVVVGNGTSALTYLYANAIKEIADNKDGKLSKTLVLGTDGLWRSFSNSSQENQTDSLKIANKDIKFSMGQPHEFLYTLNCWNSCKKNREFKKGGEDYIKIGEYLDMMDKLKNEIENLYNPVSGNNFIRFLPDKVYHISYNKKSKDYHYKIMSQIDIKDFSGPKNKLEQVFYAKKVIVATGLALEKEHKDIKNLKVFDSNTLEQLSQILKEPQKIKRTDPNFSSWMDLLSSIISEIKSFSKKAKWSDEKKEYDVLVNGSKYVSRRYTDFYTNNSPFTVVVDGSGAVAAWAVERAMLNGITDISWISKHDFTRANAWGRNDKIIQKAAERGMLYMGKIENIDWLGKDREEPIDPSVQLKLEPIKQEERQEIFIQAICRVIRTKLDAEFSETFEQKKEFKNIIIEGKNVEEIKKSIAKKIKEFTLNFHETKESDKDEIVLIISLPGIDILVTKKDIQNELFHQLTGIKPNDRFKNPRINFIEKKEIKVVHQYINAPGPGEDNLEFLDNDIHKNLIAIEDKESRITENEKTTIGLKDNQGLEVIGPAAYRYMQKPSRKNPGDSNKYKEDFQKYEKIRDLFSQTNNTEDGIAVTRAAIKVLTGFREFPSKEDLKGLETEDLKPKIKNLTKVFEEGFLLSSDKAEEAAKYFHFFNWNTTDLLETREYFKKFFGWEEEKAERAAHKFIFGYPPKASPDDKPEKFLEARDDRTFGFTQEDLIGFNEEEIIELNDSKLEGEQIGKIKDSVLYKLKIKIENPK